VRPAYWLGAIALLAALCVAGVSVGAVAIRPGRCSGRSPAAATRRSSRIVRDLRVPRVALAALVGVALGGSGAALQGVLRNALAEPYLLGVERRGRRRGGRGRDARCERARAAPARGVRRRGGRRGAGARGRPRRRGASDVRLLLTAGVVVGAFANAAVMVALADAPRIACAARCGG
jgi:iron complex transport system permease protein